MNHLDELEAESVFILREAFAKLDKLAILWSLGKDSNVVLWLVPQGLLRPRAVPGDARRHREEVPRDVRLPRPLREGVEPQLHPRAVPAGRGHRPDPAAGRPLRRAQDAGPQGRGRQARLQRPDRSASAATRRRSAPRSATSQPARRGQQLEPQGPAARVLEPVHDQLPGRARTSASTRCCIGPRSTSGSTPSARASRSSTSTSPRTASATAPWATRTSPRPSPVDASTLDEIITELETTNVPERSGRAMDHESEDAFERLRAAGYL